MGRSIDESHETLSMKIWNTFYCCSIRVPRILQLNAYNCINYWSIRFCREIYKYNFKHSKKLNWVPARIVPMNCGPIGRFHSAAQTLFVHFLVPGTKSNSEHPVSRWISIYESSCYHLQNTRVPLKLIKNYSFVMRVRLRMH